MIINPRVHEAYKLLHEGTLALSRAEQHGIRVDIDYINRKKTHLTRRIERMEKEFRNTKFFKHWQHATKSTVNINSNAQLAFFLYKIKKIEPTKLTESGQGSIDEEALKQLKIPELDSILEIRKLKKIRDTYLTSFEREQVKGIIHPFFNLHLVRTYRSSSDSPNFQNIPKRDEEAMQICRKALYPSIGNQLLEIDFSGIEVRISACYHKDENMLKYINDPTTDMHSDIAKQVFHLDKIDKKTIAGNLMRQAAKNGFVFPQFYGDYYKNCASNIAEWVKLPQNKRWKTTDGIQINEKETIGQHLLLGSILNYNEFVNHIKEIEYDFWNNRFFEYNKWKETWYKLYQKYGYIVMKTGFVCSGVMSKNDVINYPVQGAAFHCLLWSLIEIDKFLFKEGWKSRIIGQIHDAIIFDVYPTELEKLKKRVKEVTCVLLPKAWDWIIVPMDIEAELCPIDASWAEKEKCSI